MKRLFRSPRRIGKTLKLIVIGMGLFGILVYGVFAMYFPDMADEPWELKAWILPWMIAILLTAIPCYAVLVLVWRMASDMERDHIFTRKNVSRLEWTARLAAWSGIYFEIMNVVYWLCGINHPGIVLASLLVLFLCLAFAFVVRALAFLVSRAADLEDENRLTI